MPLVIKNYDFWLEFFDHLTENDSKLNAYDPEIEELYDKYAHICHFHLRENNIDNLCLIGVINLELKVIAAKFLVVKDEERIYDLLNKNKEYRKLIQAQFIQQVYWDKPPKFSVGVYKYDVNFNDISEREDLFEWLHKNLDKLQVFLTHTADQYSQ